MTEDEQIARLKEWWSRNGMPLVTGGLLALAVVFGWQAWQNHQTNKAQGASVVYQQLVETALGSEKPDTARVAELAAQLKNDFGGTHYAQFGSLFVAKVAVEAGQLYEAAAELRTVLDKPASADLEELARQRLARVLSAQGKGEEGLALLDGKVDAAYLAGREEVRGDLLLQLGRKQEAFAAYTKAKEALPVNGAAGTLQIKLDDLANGDA
ncbi:YfgM family protein [Pseudomonas flexibilis]|uniref:Ancillary SecYEG translocon subunit n=1 Tax=Pseudomonas flexibilis TaxID=706570 RepID=A0A0B3BZ58_9PSED|nr:YfgM family protein [Pseudomonas flexibilis]KHO65969.1 GTP-binding protein [Pseudomonas flexibilis]